MMTSTVVAQIPAGNKSIRIHNDDITWYEAINGSHKSVVCNGKVLTRDYSSVECIHGFLFIQPEGVHDWYYVYDRQGEQINLPGHNNSSIVREYKIIGNQLYFIYFNDVWDQNYNLISKKGIFDVGEKPYSFSREKGLIDLTTGKTVISPSNGITDIEKIEIAGQIYIKTKKNYSQYGIFDLNGNEILATEFQYCDYLGDNLFSFKMNDYWGVMKKDGTIIIPLSRQYSSLSYSRTFKNFAFVKRVGNVVYKGECNATGKQTVIQKDHIINNTPSKKTEPEKKSPSRPQTEKTTEKPTPTPKPEPRQPQPFQVWVSCFGCGGSGKCQTCGGLGWRYLTQSEPHAQCISCGGSGKCSMCAGQGGHNEIQYR